MNDQGEDRTPQIHLVPNVAAMLDKGIQTERGDLYLSIKAAMRALLEQNQQLEDLNRLIGQTEQIYSKAREAIETVKTLLIKLGTKDNNSLTYKSNHYLIQGYPNKLIISRLQSNTVLLDYQHKSIIENNLSEEYFNRFSNLAKQLKKKKEVERYLER